MNNKTSKKAVIILGPTSSGKSAIAIKLAKQFNGEIISADSRQVYKDMDLGTGKIEGRWHRRDGREVFVSEDIVHHLIDFRSPRGQYNVSHFQKDCVRLIKDAATRGKLPIICGGTGFWISAIVDDVKLPNVKPDKKLRKQLEKKTLQQLYVILKKLDSNRAKTIDRKNKIRLIRAIEICQTLGCVPKPNSKSEIARAHLMGGNQKYLQIGIAWPKEVLDRKIKKRLNDRWCAGMIREAKNLKKKYALSWKKIQSFGLGYYWIPLFLQNKISEVELMEKVFIAERNYAKRQRTWFKRDKTIIWEHNYTKIRKIVRNFLR